MLIINQYTEIHSLIWLDQREPGFLLSKDISFIFCVIIGLKETHVTK